MIVSYDNVIVIDSVGHLDQVHLPVNHDLHHYGHQLHGGLLEPGVAGALQIPVPVPLPRVGRRRRQENSVNQI